MTIGTVLLSLLGLFILTLSTWVTYLAAMNFDRVRKEVGVSKVAEIFAMIMLGPGILMDVLLNLFVGTLLFVQIPKEWLFTGRMKRNKDRTDWRGKLARGICKDLLDPFDPDCKHC